jgi:hypothetical protein
MLKDAKCALLQIQSPQQEFRKNRVAAMNSVMTAPLVAPNLMRPSVPR